MPVPRRMEAHVMNRKLFLSLTLVATGMATAAVFLGLWGQAQAAVAEVHRAEASVGAVAEQMGRGEALYKAWAIWMISRSPTSSPTC